MVSKHKHKFVIVTKWVTTPNEANQDETNVVELMCECGERKEL